jgi:hypothetical protein
MLSVVVQSVMTPSVVALQTFISENTCSQHSALTKAVSAVTLQDSCRVTFAVFLKKS